VNAIQTIIAKIAEFSKSDRRNEWLTAEGISIYVRNANRILSSGGSYASTLDLANITIEERGQGTFTQILGILENMDGKTLFVENVLEDRFQKFFERREGWHKLSYVEGCPSFYFFR
jgi:hypothetical protein